MKGGEYQHLVDCVAIFAKGPTGSAVPNTNYASSLDPFSTGQCAEAGLPRTTREPKLPYSRSGFFEALTAFAAFVLYDRVAIGPYCVLSSAAPVNTASLTWKPRFGFDLDKHSLRAKSPA